MEDSFTRIRIGDPVRARGRRWRVCEVRDYGSCCLFALTGAEPLNQGIERTLLTPFDRITALPVRRRVRIAGCRTWPKVLRRLIRGHVPADGLRTAGDAAIELLPFQLEPALSLIQGRGTRLLLADEVGLGKTIQASLATAELRARGLADRVLVLTPSGLRDQWADELSRRFSIEGVVVDARELRRRASVSPLGVNPWTTLDVVIASIDLVKRPEVLPSVVAAHWDLVIVDEAHTAASRSDRHAAVAAICTRAPYVLLLTATPHSGDRPAFESLCGIGGAGAEDPVLVFRRSRRAVAPVTERRVHLLHVAPGHAERQMHERLSEFTRIAEVECEHRTNIRLASAVLQKRAFSSPWSLSASVERRLAALGPGRDWPSQLTLPLGTDTGDLDADDEPPDWPMPSLQDPGRERHLLEALAVAARDAIMIDSKLRALTRLVRRLVHREERVIVFTEYRDTLDHVRRSLMLPTAIVHGGLARAERREAVHAFVKGHARVLLATDAAGEGLNLQEGCRTIVNLELPWNPNRLEQRVGRVDRIGQRRRVHAFHLIAEGVGEEDILARLHRKVTRARHDIDAVDPLTTPAGDMEAGATWTDSPSRVFPAIDPSAEVSRLSLLRTLPLVHADYDVRLPPGPIVAFASKRLRASLRGTVLAIVCSTLEDMAGAQVAQRVSALALRCAATMRRPLSRRQFDLLVAEVERSVLQYDPEAATWRDTSCRIHLSLVSRRLAREHELERRLARRTRTTQRGLFDRRAERAADASAEQERLRCDLAARRRERLYRSMQFATLVSRVALILVP